MTEKSPDDRELEQYLRGDSALSKRYRDASRETAPPELDELVLARARAEARRKPAMSRVLAPVALAASVVLGLNLAWNVWQVEPLPEPARALEDAARTDRFVSDPPPGAQKASEPMPAPPPSAETGAAAQKRKQEQRRDEHEGELRREAESARATAAEQRQEREAADPPAPQAQALAPQQQRAPARAERDASAGAASGAATMEAPTAAPRAADHVPTEAQKIDALIRYVGGLGNAVFVRNGEEHAPQAAAEHLRLKRDKAGSRCATADDFVRLCAARSSISGEPYLIRFADGRTRPAEEVLREFLMQMNAAP